MRRGACCTLLWPGIPSKPKGRRARDCHPRCNAGQRGGVLSQRSHGLDVRCAVATVYFSTRGMAAPDPWPLCMATLISRLTKVATGTVGHAQGQWPSTVHGLCDRALGGLWSHMRQEPRGTRPPVPIRYRSGTEKSIDGKQDALRCVPSSKRERRRKCGGPGREPPARADAFGHSDETSAVHPLDRGSRLRHLM